MEILVCIKQVPSSNKVQVDPVTGVLLRDGVDSKMNPYDLYALETALLLKEQVGGTVSVITMGPMQAIAVIREAYAMGADRGAIISDRKFGGADVLATSYTLTQGIKAMGNFDLILCGKQTTDGDTAQVGPEISEWMKIPCIANVTKIKSIEEKSITVMMDMEKEVEIVKVKFPCLLTVDVDIFQPRLPSFVKQEKSKDRNIQILTFQEMLDQNEMNYGLSGSPTQVKRIFPPENNDEHEIWMEDTQIQVNKLYQKLKEFRFV